MMGIGITWDCYIAEKLSKSLEEVNAMSQEEYETWIEYFNIKSVLRDLTIKTEQNRNK